MKSFLAEVVVVWCWLSMGCQSGPAPIQLNKEACQNCNMTISDGRFGAVAVSNKGRSYKFDDLSCLMQYRLEHKEIQFSTYYMLDFEKPGNLVPAGTASFVSHESIRSPMKGHTASFGSKTNAAVFAKNLATPVLQWKEVSENW